MIVHSSIVCAFAGALAGLISCGAPPSLTHLPESTLPKRWDTAGIEPWLRQAISTSVLCSIDGGVADKRLLAWYTVRNRDSTVEDHAFWWLRAEGGVEKDRIVIHLFRTSEEPRWRIFRIEGGDLPRGTWGVDCARADYADLALEVARYWFVEAFELKSVYPAIIHPDTLDPPYAGIVVLESGWNPREWQLTFGAVPVMARVQAVLANPRRWPPE